jgi:hypothetical protein
MDMHAQDFAESQRRAIERTIAMVKTRQAQLQQFESTRLNSVGTIWNGDVPKRAC